MQGVVFSSAHPLLHHFKFAYQKVFKHGLGMAGARRLPTSTQDAPRCHTIKLSHAGLKAANRELVGD